jgi:glycosyltransferase involved in cell wall biosynthesis
MPKLLYFVTEDWFFFSHFMPMARAARADGFEVVVATRVGTSGHLLEAEGIRIISVGMNRGSLGLLEGVRSLIRAVKIVRSENAAVIHCIALRSVVIGGIAARLGAPGTGLVLAPTGLGHLWTTTSLLTRAARGVVRFLIGSWLRGSRTRYVFENTDDPRELGLDPHGNDVTIVGGAGVAPADFPLQPEPPAPPIKIAVVARMIWPKGIAEAVEATRRARAQGLALELHLFGQPDPSNPRSIPLPTLRQWSAEPGVVWHGQVKDVSAIWRDHHIALLLTAYREGLPRALIEAAASGRPIVTTDVPGCRDLVRNGVEGFLVPKQNSEAAATALVRLSEDPVLRSEMGMAAHRRFQEHFTEARVQSAVAAIYRSLVPL